MRNWTRRCLSVCLLLVHASPAEPGLRPARIDGKPTATYAEQGDPIANQRGAVRGMHRRFSWDALNVTNDTSCGADKCFFPGVREGEGYLVCWRRSPLIQLSKAWAFAEELRVDFGVDHLMRGPPFLANLTREQAKHLNAGMRKVLGDRTLTLALMGP